jgi:hypothetical protein
MWQALLALAGALALAGCDSGTVPSPAQRQAGEAVPAPIAANAVELRSEGLAAGSEAFFFAAGQKEVETALAKVLGPVLRTGANNECGAGPVTFTDFAGGLTVHFQDARMVGWNWHLAQDGDTPPTGMVKLAGEVQVGSARELAAAAALSKVATAKKCFMRFSSYWRSFSGSNSSPSEPSSPASSSSAAPAPAPARAPPPAPTPRRPPRCGSCAPRPAGRPRGSAPPSRPAPRPAPRTRTRTPG